MENLRGKHVYGTQLCVQLQSLYASRGRLKLLAKILRENHQFQLGQVTVILARCEYADNRKGYKGILKLIITACWLLRVLCPPDVVHVYVVAVSCLALGEE